VEQIMETYSVIKGAPNPALESILGDHLGSLLLADEKEYMSKRALLMYLSQRTFPEICPAVTKLSTKYNKATKEDLKKAMRIVEYMFDCKEAHKLVIKMIIAADATSAKRPDGKSHRGGKVGFKSEMLFWSYIIQATCGG